MAFNGESALRAALDSFFACSGRELTIFFVNPAAELARRTAAELVGQNVNLILALLQPGPFNQANLQSVMDTRTPLVCECRESAQNRWFEMTVIPDEATWLSIWLHNITQRKEIENSLRDDKNLYRSIFAALHEGIVFLDPGGG